MTDITALMATMKAAAEKAKHAGEAPVMDFNARIDALNEFQLAACPANVLTLVEALEKAQQRIAELESCAVELPLPSCTYADHSYPAYSKRQVVSILAAAGIQVIEGEGQ